MKQLHSNQGNFSCFRFGGIIFDRFSRSVLLCNDCICILKAETAEPEEVKFSLVDLVKWSSSMVVGKIGKSVRRKYLIFFQVRILY